MITQAWLDEPAVSVDACRTRHVKLATAEPEATSTLTRRHTRWWGRGPRVRRDGRSTQRPVDEPRSARPPGDGDHTARCRPGKPPGRLTPIAANRGRR